MKKTWLLLVALLLCGLTASAQAAQKLNIDLDKDHVFAHEVSAAGVRIAPEGMMRVIRHSLWSWDDEGSRWSLFAELENVSDEKVVIDENALIAENLGRSEAPKAKYVFECTTNVLMPGEKAVLHAGAYPYVQGKRTDADVSSDVWNVYGMEDLADSIRLAECLRIRLDVRGNQSGQTWRRMDIEPKVWVEENTIHFEWINTTEGRVDFRTVGAVMCDEQGRIVDVIRTSFSRGASVMPGETLHIEKEIAPYVTRDMAEGLQFGVFAYQMPDSPVN